MLVPDARQRGHDPRDARVAAFVNDGQSCLHDAEAMRRQIAHQPFPILEPGQIGIEQADLGKHPAPRQQGRAETQRAAPYHGIEAGIARGRLEATLLAGPVIMNDVTRDAGERIGRSVS